MARLAWLVLPLLLAPVVDDAMAGTSRPVRTLAAVGLWAGWGLGATALLIRRPVTLTAVRILAPAAVATAVVAALTNGTSGLIAASAISIATIAAVAVLLPAFGDRWADGASYGSERRFLLRPPAPVYAVLPFAWAVLVASVITGPLLLAARQWVAGTLVSLAGAVVAVVVLRALHGLARRWIVLVPTGLVLHDPLVTSDPFLCLRAETVHLGPAGAGERLDGDRHCDLTVSAPGIVLTLVVEEPVAITRRTPARRATAVEVADHLHFVPSRPGAVLAEAARRRFPIRT